MTDSEEKIKSMKGLMVELNELYSKEHSLLYKELQELKKDCSHSELDEKDEYSSGDYLNKSTNTHVIFCTICNKRLEEKMTYGSYG